jgi:hypothetical protein
VIFEEGDEEDNGEGPPRDLNCGDPGVPNDFKVIGSDPNDFDRDNDGIGCESNGSELPSDPCIENPDLPQCQALFTGGECPEGQTGTPPNCEPTEPTEPISGEYPEGQTGTPPNCEPTEPTEPTEPIPPTTGIAVDEDTTDEDTTDEDTTDEDTTDEGDEGGGDEGGGDEGGGDEGGGDEGGGDEGGGDEGGGDEGGGDEEGTAE